VRADDVDQPAPSGSIHPIFNPPGYFGDVQDWDLPDTNFSLPTLEDGALPNPSQEAASWNPWADNYDHMFDTLSDDPFVYAEIEDPMEVDIDEILEASRILDVAGGLEMSSATLELLNPAPALPCDDSVVFDPDELHQWKMPQPTDLPAKVLQDGTEQSQLGAEALPSYTNTHQPSSFVCDICPRVCYDSISLKSVLAGRMCVQPQQLTRSRRHKVKHTAKVRQHLCKVEGCGFGFQHEKDLRKHHACKHDRSLLTPHRCEEKEGGEDCGKVYDRSDHLLRHMRKKHPDCPKTLAIVAASTRKRRPPVQPARSGMQKSRQRTVRKRAARASSSASGSRNPASSEQNTGQALPFRTSLPAPEPIQTTYGELAPTTGYSRHVATPGTSEWASMYNESTSYSPGPGSYYSAPRAPEPNLMTYDVPAPMTEYEWYTRTSSTAEWTYREPSEPTGLPRPGSSSSAPHE
jgi:hypothetical protein